MKKYSYKTYSIRDVIRATADDNDDGSDAEEPTLTEKKVIQALEEGYRWVRDFKDTISIFEKEEEIE
jgi:hypothetical protein